MPPLRQPIRQPAAADDATLERLAELCRQGAGAAPRRTVLSGYAELDALLPAGGWPLGAITELLSNTPGIGELSLFIPALSRLAQAGRYIAWIAPPYQPYAPALAQRGLPLERVLIIQTRTPQDTLWASEQALRCSKIGAVLGWPAHIVDKNLRRLQLAAESGGTLGILHRSAEAAHTASPAALRLQLHAVHAGLLIEIRKARGGHAGRRLHLRDIDAVAMHSFARADA